jgi:predicted lipid carrier protein YhbT
VADVTARFFDELSRRGHEPHLHGVTGSIRFDLSRGGRTEHWLVAIDAGDVTVSRENVEADSVFRADRALFDQLASGEANAMASLLRGAVGIEGDLELTMRFQRVFPGPRRSTDERAAAGYARRQS